MMTEMDQEYIERLAEERIEALHAWLERVREIGLPPHVATIDFKIVAHYDDGTRCEVKAIGVPDDESFGSPKGPIQ